MTTIEEGKFQLYSHITPALKADDYRFTVTQELEANKSSDTLDDSDLPVDSLTTHVRVTAPRYQLPPDQVLSTFPPAGTEGMYGSRLPQVVIKRRTLPWERGLTMPGADGTVVTLDPKTPWLALVLIAEGEAELLLNENVEDCVTTGIELDGEVDVAKGNCLLISKSMLEKVLPTRLDVPLLAHARQVDIHDTELMMGDDDGFLAVVISNRLPVPGVDAQGKPVPVKYLACLINLEGQFHRLIPKAPEHRDTTALFGLLKDVYVGPAVFDHVAAGDLVEHWGDPHVNPVVLDEAGGVRAIGDMVAETGGVGGDFLAEPIDAPLDGPAPRATHDEVTVASIKNASAGSAAYSAEKGHVAEYANIYDAMAGDFAKVNVTSVLEPKYRFPVLLHWSFVSAGEKTFEHLMQHLDSGLLGTQPKEPYDETGREPLEVVETGHVGLTQRTRVGDTMRAWYRGPLLPHPSSGERLPIAHSSDQLRAIVGDEREDISLAAAFEVGRLLALSRPSMVAALLRWRQTQFQLARSGGIWKGTALPFDDLVFDSNIRHLIETKLREMIVVNPDDMIGPHRPLVTPGDPIDWGGDAYDLVASGFGLDLDLAGGLTSIDALGTMVRDLGRLTPHVVDTLRDDLGARVIDASLASALDRSVEQIMSNVLANEIVVDSIFGSSVLRSPEMGEVVIVDGGILDPSGRVIVDDRIGLPGGGLPGGGPGGGGIPGGGVIDGGVIDGGLIDGGLISAGVIGSMTGLGVVVPHLDGPLADQPDPPRRRRRRRGSPDALDELIARRGGTANDDDTRDDTREDTGDKGAQR